MNLHNGFRNHNCGFPISCSKCSTIGTSTDLFTWLKLYPKLLFRSCLHLRLTVWTQSPKINILASMCAINEIFSRLVDIESPLTHSNTSRSGITSANVKIIVANVDSTLNVGTLLVDDQHFTIYFSALFVLVAFVHTLSDVRDVFLLRLPGILLTLWPCLGCAVSRSVLMNFS